METPRGPGRSPGWYQFGSRAGRPRRRDRRRRPRRLLEYDRLPVRAAAGRGGGHAVIVTEADGSVIAYSVIRAVVEKGRRATGPWFDRSGAPRLVLVTCGGAFDVATSGAISNVVVTAEPDR